MSAVSAIEYFHYNNTLSGNYFKQKQEKILQNMRNQLSQVKFSKLNSALSQAELNLQQMVQGTDNVTEQELKKAIEKSLAQHTNLGTSLETISKNISGYVQQQGQFLNPNAKALQQAYSQGYGNLYNLIQQVRAKNGTTMDTKFLNKILQQTNPKALLPGVAQIGTYLGDIGEVVGQALLKNIGDELLSTSFKNIPGVTATVENTGNQKTKPLGIHTATSDNVLVIRGSNNTILFQLNLSNKMNTKFTVGATSTGRVIKIASKKVGQFLKDQTEDQEAWEKAVYNTFSYHWDNSKRGRRDYYTTSSGTLMRQTIGMQMLYNHIYGTRESISSGDQLISDTVYLMAYGNKIFASEEVLKTALARHANKQRFNMARVEMNRAVWFNPKGMWQRGKVNRDIQNEYDIQKKIAAFNLTYQQTVKFS